MAPFGEGLSQEFHFGGVQYGGGGGGHTVHRHWFTECKVKTDIKLINVFTFFVIISVGGG